MQQTQIKTASGLTLNCASWNIDTNISRAQKPEFKDVRIGERMSSITAKILELTSSRLPIEKQVHVFFHQELRRFEGLSDSLVLIDWYREHNFTVFELPRCPDSKSMVNIIAINPCVPLAHQTKDMSDEDDDNEKWAPKLFWRYLNKSPNGQFSSSALRSMHAPIEQLKDFNYGTEFEGNVACVLLHILDRENGRVVPVALASVHMPIQKNLRLIGSQCLVEMCKDVRAHNPDARIVIAGDFNVFDDWGGAEQMALILTQKEIDLTEHLRAKATVSFNVFPGDMGAETGNIAKQNRFQEIDVARSQGNIKEVRRLYAQLYRDFPVVFGSLSENAKKSGQFSLLDRIFTTQNVAVSDIDVSPCYMNQNITGVTDLPKSFCADFNDILAEEPKCLEHLLQCTLNGIPTSICDHALVTFSAKV